ncbi:amino acid permease [Virgibacillus sp. C22-A2]|uniref:Amino acid permease n=1 Tax=Virgibacillus tibetensis TaxID=3042313 RepID=A0ABU6KDI0_9BACI|nr:amino acid permease [Virgibacillus sp. C22-A2]
MKNRGLDSLPKNTMGFWMIWALGVGAVIGDGIFLMMGEGIATAGPSAIFAYIIAGIFQLFLMVALAELAVGMPNAGAMSKWVERFMGSSWGFLSGFLFAIGWVIVGGSVGLALGTITQWFFPNLTGDYWQIVFAVFFLTVFALLNIFGTNLAARSQLIMVLILTTIMALFALIGLKDVKMENFSPMMPHGLDGFWSAIPLGTYAYLGAVTLATAGGELKKPKDLPKALIWSSITFIILYSAAQFTLQGIIPWEQVSIDSSPFTLAAEQVFGFAGAFIVNVAAWIAAATCILMGTLYSASRIFYAQSKEGYLPKFFSYIHPKTKTPVYSIAVIWAASVSLILIGSINPHLIYVELSNQLVLAWLVSWTLALMASVLYRRRNPEEIKGLPWRQPLYPLFPILAFVGIIIVFVGSFIGSPMTLVRGIIWMGLIYILFKLLYKPNQENEIKNYEKPM